MISISRQSVDTDSKDDVDVLPTQIHTESFLDLILKIKYFRFLFLIWLAKYSTRKIVLDDTVARLYIVPFE